jgi:hypothetical protein
MEQSAFSFITVSITDPHWTVPEYLNVAKCENMISWWLELKSISFAYFKTPAVDLQRRLHVLNIQDLFGEGRISRI